MGLQREHAIEDDATRLEIDRIYQNLNTKNRYIDRGDPTAMDYTTSNFSIDGAWHNLDLKDIVTDTDAVSVHFYCDIKDGNTSWNIWFRKDGTVGGKNNANISTEVANITKKSSDMICALNDRKIEYQVQSGMDAINMVVRGWWTP